MISVSESDKAESAAKTFENRYGRVFVLSDHERESLLAYDARLMDYRPQATTSLQALERLNKHTGERVDKLREVKKDLSREYDQIAMIQNTSFLYLYFCEISQGNGWSKEQIVEAFEAQLKFYNEISLAAKDLISRRIKGFLISNNRQAVAARDRLAKRKPSWYQQDLQTWLNLMHDEFFAESDIRKRLTIDINDVSIGKSDVTYRVTSQEFVPEWLSNMRDDDQSEIPTAETVESDVIEDEYAKKRLVDEFMYVDSKLQYLVQLAVGRGRKTIGRNTEKIRELLPDPFSLSELLLFLADTDGVVYYKLDPDKIPEMTPAAVNSTALRDEAKEEWVIRRFAQNAEMSEEMLRIYLKKKFDELKLFEVPNEERMMLIATLLADIGGDKLADLRQKDKKAFQKINFDLRPMISAIPEEILAELREQLVDNPFVNQDQLIRRFATVIANSLWGTLQSRDCVKLKEEYLKFVVNWLKNNWRDAYAALFLQIHKPADFQTGSEIDTDEHNAQDGNSGQVSEIESEIIEAKIGRLAGWEILFDVNKNGDRHMEELSGESLEDIETQLENILNKHRISCSIKLSSVVNTLEWITTIPKEVIQIMIRESINGLDYLKIKRGNVRLFFQIDSDKKQLRFFVYQKQSLEYHF